MLSHARSTAPCSRSAATRSVNGSIRVVSSSSMPCCPEISRVLPRLSLSTPPPKLSLLFWVSSASGLARAVTLSTHVPHTKLRRAVSIAQPRLCLGRGGALPRGSQYLEFNAQNRMEACPGRTQPRAGDTYYLSSWAGQRRAAQGSGSGCKLRASKTAVRLSC